MRHTEQRAASLGSQARGARVIKAFRTFTDKRSRPDQPTGPRKSQAGRAKYDPRWSHAEGTYRARPDTPCAPRSRRTSFGTARPGPSSDFSRRSGQSQTCRRSQLRTLAEGPLQCKKCGASVQASKRQVGRWAGATGPPKPAKGIPRSSAAGGKTATVRRDAVPGRVSAIRQFSPYRRNALATADQSLSANGRPVLDKRAAVTNRSPSGPRGRQS